MSVVVHRILESIVTSRKGRVSRNLGVVGDRKVERLSRPVRGV